MSAAASAAVVAALLLVAWLVISGTLPPPRYDPALGDRSSLASPSVTRPFTRTPTPSVTPSPTVLAP